MTPGVSSLPSLWFAPSVFGPSPHLPSSIFLLLPSLPPSPFPFSTHGPGVPPTIALAFALTLGLGHLDAAYRYFL
ncbi:hypothetical protein BDZ94DRAFT_819943 [Collybia nuda]|uniref:Uncharacterized protein n=1 Tax=Collybia nuda TaxID=64659 RepID=A0A9P6CD48_9AGAR|nr:hypothetical protein BDZ94DRAFT_819943 [Collybia nuda]